MNNIETKILFLQVALVLGFSASYADEIAEKNISKNKNIMISKAQLGRQELEKQGDLLVRKANELFSKNEERKAISEYLSAIKIFQNFDTEFFKKKADYCRTQIGNCYYSLANKAMAKAESEATAKDFETAIRICKEAIEYYPEGKVQLNAKIKEFEKRRLDAIDYSEATTDKLLPEKASQEYKIAVLLQQGRELFINGEYIRALRKFNEVLLIDPYNEDALQNILATNTKIGSIADKRYTLTHRKLMAELEWEFALPITEDGANLSGNMLETSKKKSEPNESNLLKKLRSIIIPRIDFEDVSLEAAIKNLRDQSALIDPEETGVNIFIRGLSGTVVEDKESNSDVANDEGFVDNAQLGDVNNTENIDAEISNSIADKKITLLIKDKSLLDCIKVLCREAGLRYKIEKYAVVLADKDTPLDTLKLKTFPIDPQQIRKIESSSSDEGGNATGGDGLGGGDNAEVDSGPLMTFFKAHKIDFPTGSKIMYNSRLSTLFVINTVENLVEIENLINDVFSEQEPLVQVVVKFLEISQNDLQELAFNYQYSANTAKTPYNNSSTVIQNSSNSLLRYYRDPETATSSDPKAEANYSFMWQNKDGSTFNAQLFALNQADSSDILASPRVTTRSGELATIKMITRRFFPDEWESPDLPEISAPSIGTDYFYVDYAGPQATFDDEAEELGIIFTIQPMVDPEKRTISAKVKLPIRTFTGWTEFVPPSNEDDDVEYIKTAIFDVRQIESTITAKDGETIVLGGMTTDLVTTVNDKIPILGDIPLIGRMFQSKYNDSQKSNILVFATFRIVNPDGSFSFPMDHHSKGVMEYEYDYKQ